ncbi:MAG: APC family permease [Longimicrobiales bacterium]
MTESAAQVRPARASAFGLLRVFGVAFGVAVAIGNTIGAGILRTPGQIAEYVPGPVWFMGIWLLGGLYALLGAVSLAELGAALPRSGGQTVFVRRALGGYAGFAVGWSDWISTCASTALVSLVIGEYAAALFPSLVSVETVLALMAALLFAALHLSGARQAGRTQVFTSVAKTLAFLLLIAACFLLRKERPPSVDVASVIPLGTGVVLALQAVIYTYDGWTGPIYFSEEVRDPGRDIPRAMVWGVLSVIGIYVLTNLAFLYVIPVSAMAGQPLVAARAAGEVFGPRGDQIIRWLTLVSMLSAVNALTLMAPRIIYAMGNHGLPAATRRADARGTPTVALWLSTTVTVAFIATGTVQTVIALAAFFFVANYTLSFFSVFVLRRREPLLHRPYRAWGYPFTTGIVLVGSLAFLAAAVSADTRHALYSMALLALSWPVYRLLSHAGPAQKDE